MNKEKTKEMLLVDKYYEDLNKKLKTTTMFYSFLNILLFILGAAIIVLNIFAIRMNPGGKADKWLFVIVAILTAITSFFTSFISLFTYRKKNKKLNTQIELIATERAQHKNKILEYEVKNRDAVLIERVRRIINK